MAAAEARNPRRNISKAIKKVYFRVLVLYIGSVFIIGLLVPSNDSSLDATSSHSSASPFVIAFKEAGIMVLPSVCHGSEFPVSFEALTQ
jgi:amino acid transporter